jgi:hypothetical protein
MIEVYSKYLLFHGSIVLMAGIITGFFFWLVIILGKANESVRAWRVAHSVLIADGLMILIAGLTVPHLNLNAPVVWVLVAALILSGYGFVFAFVIGAWKGLRGLIPKPFGLNTILFVGHFIGATGSFIGIAILIYGLFVSL